MGLWPFGRKKADDMSVETLLDRANAASPTGAVPTAAPAPRPRARAGPAPRVTARSGCPSRTSSPSRAEARS